MHTGPGASRPAGYSLAFARSGSSSSNRLGSSSRGDRARGVWRFMEFGSRFSSSLVYKDGECRDSGIPPSSAEAGSVRQNRCQLMKGKKFWLGKKKKKNLCAGAVNPPPPAPAPRWAGLKFQHSESSDLDRCESEASVEGAVEKRGGRAGEWGGQKETRTGCLLWNKPQGLTQTPSVLCKPVISALWGRRQEDQKF